jgi:uncharacterized protein (DUF427 family)
MPDPEHHPQHIAPIGHVAPVPRRIRAELAGRTVLDTLGAYYLWEKPFYPQFQIPAVDIDADLLTTTEQTEELAYGTVARVDLAVGQIARPGAGERCVSSPTEALVDTVHLDWKALDVWYEEDEQVFVHPRDPYTRVDALRSRRRIRVERQGILLAESDAPVIVFETGLPPRYYLDRTAVDFSHLRPSDTVSECPYKGTTSEYWSVEIEGKVIPDLAWSYAFPTRQLLPITGLVAFYDERVDVSIDGVAQPRPKTHF